MLLRLWCNIILFSSIFISVSRADNNSTRFRVIYEWNYVNFTWPSADAYQNAVNTAKYIPENIHISGVKYFNDNLYLTVPRMREGVPATLTRIPYKSLDNNTAPLLEPFPSWEMNVQGNCSALQNVQNVEIDPKGYLYILDGGKTNTITKTPLNDCDPRLIIFDIPSNQIVTIYTFPKEMTNSGSFLYDLVVDDVDGGYVYITDNSGNDPGIIVYSIKNKKSWIIRDDTMKARPEAVDFLVNGTAVSAAINIAGIALGPRKSMVHDDHEIVTHDRMVYYCPLSSYRLYSISSSVLQDEKSADSGIVNYVQDLGRKASQSDGIVMDENGVLYYGLLADSSIARWDSRAAPFASGQKVIARDRTFIQWPDSIAFDMEGNILVVTNKLQKFIYGQMDIQQANYRILQGHVGSKSYLYSNTFTNEQERKVNEEPRQQPSERSTTTSTTTMRTAPVTTMEDTERTPNNLYYNVDTTTTTQNPETTEDTVVQKVNAAHLSHLSILTFGVTLLLIVFIK